MALRPDAILSAAKALDRSQSPTGEARYRTIVGRAYYAAYLTTRDAICDVHRLPPESYLPHDTICVALTDRTQDVEVRVLGTKLNTLRNDRVHADYKLRKDLLEMKSSDALEDAEAIIALVARLRDRLPKVNPVPMR